MGIKLAIIFALAVASLISLASAIPGVATFFDPPYIPSSCFGFQDQGPMIAAANPALYNNGAACGRRYRIRCNSPLGNCRTGAQVTVRIVDLCAECGPNQIALSREAFGIIAPLDLGRIQIDYTQI